MKTDLNTILYIIVSIIIIAASSLGKKRRKQSGGLPGNGARQPGLGDPEDPDPDREAQRPEYQTISQRPDPRFMPDEEVDPDWEIVDSEGEDGSEQQRPFWEREWILEDEGTAPAGQKVSPEDEEGIGDAEVPVPDEAKGIVDEEEQIVDEEELYMKEKEEGDRKTNFPEETVVKEPEMTRELPDDDLFGDLRELRKAIIYSEILKRPEY